MPKVIEDPEQLFSLREAVPLVGLSAATLRRLCASGSIPCKKIGFQFALSGRTAQELRDHLTPPDGYITVREAMVTAGVSRSRIHDLISRKRVKSIKREWLNSRLVWVEKESLEKWIEWRDWEKNKLANMTDSEKFEYEVWKENYKRIVRNYEQRKRRAAKK